MASIEKMIAIVQIYIHHRKDVEISGISIHSPFDLLKLQRAYQIAITWLNENGFKQI